MAFSSGFFNARGLDRTYTAEDFCNYLGSLICNGILDSYGDCFSLKTDDLTVILGTGKAWLNGHFFISDSDYMIDMKPYQDEGNPRYISIGIVLDTSEAVRNVTLEVIPGVPAGNPSVPEIPADGERTVLHLYAVRVSPGVESITEDDILDYRDDAAKCGYCKCILGKCGVTVLMDKVAELEEVIQDNNNKIEELTGRIDELTEDVVETGSCGDNIEYTLLADGRLFLRGSGDMFDYSSPISDVQNPSPFRDRDDLTSVTVGNGITSIGDFAFENTINLTRASFPQSLRSIGNSSFMYADNYVGIVHGLKSLRLPDGITTIQRKAFMGTALTEVMIPQSVTNVGDLIFADCTDLKTVRYEGVEIGATMFSRCDHLDSFTIAVSVEKIGTNVFPYCKSIHSIRYEGTLAQWQSIPKGSGWDGHGGMEAAQSALEKVQCSDGYMQFDAESNEWTEVRT